MNLSCRLPALDVVAATAAAAGGDRDDDGMWYEREEGVLLGATLLGAAVARGARPAPFASANGLLARRGDAPPADIRVVSSCSAMPGDAVRDGEARGCAPMTDMSDVVEMSAAAAAGDALGLLLTDERPVC